MNRQLKTHARHLTERYEHATLETNRKELNRTGRLISKLCFTDQMGSLPIWFTFSHIWVKLNYTFFIFFFIEFTIPKDKIKTFKTTPVHLLHTIGSQKYFGHFAFQQTAAFHYKKVVWIQTPKKTDEKHDIQMKNRKLFFFFLILILCN